MHTTEFEVLETLKQPYCPLCRLAQESAKDYLAGVLGDGVNDADVRDDWRRRGGLCGRHWRVWRGLDAAALSSAIMAQDLLGSYLDNGFPKKRECRACQTEGEAEGRYLQSLRGLPEAKVEEALAAGRGFMCFRHLDMLKGGPLKDAFKGRLEGVQGELAEFIRKNDYRYAHEPSGDERDSWLRALRALGGEV
ncbi:hypothetical protein BH24DEI1_BH24DEI1_11940 [soil metagenome]